jgi:hypothetical protein
MTMKHFNVFVATLVLTCFAMVPAVAKADEDELEDLDVTATSTRSLTTSPMKSPTPSLIVKKKVLTQTRKRTNSKSTKMNS